MTARVMRIRALAIALCAVLVIQMAAVAPSAAAQDVATATPPPAPRAVPAQDPPTDTSPQAAATAAPDPALPPAKPSVEIDPATGLQKGAVEIAAARTEYSQTFANPDGTRTTELFTSPKFWRTGASEPWQQVQLGFAPSGAADGFTSSRAPVSVSVAPVADQDFVTVSSGGYTIGFGIPGAIAAAAAAGRKPAAPVVDGPAADYAGVLPGTDLRVIANADGAKSFFIWRSAPKDPSLAYVVDAPGLTLVPQADGSITLADAKGSPVARIPRPYAVDSTPGEAAGSGRFTDAVKLELGTDGRTVTVSVDPAWLEGAVYPVYVDPSTGWIPNAGSNAYGDAFTTSGFPTWNWGDYQRPDAPYYHELWNGVMPAPGNTGESYDFLRWDLRFLDNTSVDSATMHLYPYHQYYNAPTVENTMLRQVTGSWTESGVTWGNQPSTSSTNKISAGACVEGTWCAWTGTMMRTIVQGWINSYSTNFGFQIDTNGHASTYWKRFIASEQGGSAVPALTITYRPLTATPATPALSHALAWSLDAGGAAQTAYQAKVVAAGAACSTATSPIWDSGVVASAAASVVPGGLADLGSYTWCVRASDGGGWSAWVGGVFAYDAQQRGEDPYYTRVPFDLGGGWSLDVGVHNGEARLTRELYSIPTVGPSGDVSLAYSSADAASAGVFGYGWSSSLTQHLWTNSPSSPTLVIWMRADGGRVGFSGSGASWTVVPGHSDRLAYSGSAHEYTVTRMDQTQLVFEDSGGYRLKRTVDRFGKTLALAYTGAAITATDATGRATTIALDANSRADYVIDAAGRVWDYTVDSGGDLTLITEPVPGGAGSCATRAPQTILSYLSHRPSSIARPRCDTPTSSTDATVLWHIDYDGAGRAMGVIDPIAWAQAQSSGPANGITYHAGTATQDAWTEVALLQTYAPASSNTTTYTLDALGRVTSSTDPLGQATALAWNVDSTLASATDAEGAVTRYAYDAAGRQCRMLENATTANPDLTCTSPVTGSTATDNVLTTYAYNGSNDPLQVVTASWTADQVATVYLYDALGAGAAPGHLVQVTENAGGSPQAVTQYAYNSSDMVAAELDPLGVVTTHTYDGNGNETQTVHNCTNALPPANWWQCAATGTHDKATNVTDTTAYTPASTAGRLGLPDSVTTGATDVAGTTTTYTYDTLGRTTVETGPAGATTRSWDQFGGETKTVDPRGATTRVFDLRGNLTDVVAPGLTTHADYDATGSPVTATTPTQTVSTQYNAVAAPVSVTVSPASPAVHAQRAYDGAGRLVAETDAAGTVTRTSYDARGRVTRVVQNCTDTGTTVPADPAWRACAGTGTRDATWNLTTDTAYDARGNRVQETAPNGRVTRYVYDGLDRLVQQVENWAASPTLPTQNVTTDYAYDAAGRQVAVRAPSPAGGTSVTITAYDSLGRAVTAIANCSDVITPANWWQCTGTATPSASVNVVTTYAYDGAGNRVAVTAPDPSATSGSSTATTTTRYAYDTANRLCRVLENAGLDLQSLADPCSTAVTGTATTNVSTRYTYDAAGRLATMVDGNGHTTAYGYDSRGRMTTLQDADPGSTPLVWSYDDVAGTKSQRNRTDTRPGPVFSAGWAYDGAGRLVSRTYLDSAGATRTTAYTYDAAGFLASASDGASSIAAVNDRLGRPVTVTVSGDAAATTTYSYSFTAPARTDASGAYTMQVDAFGRLTSLTDPIHGSPFTWAYGPGGQVQTFTMPNGNAASYAYDALGRLLASATGARASYTYAYNQAGSRLSEASAVTGDPANGTATFAYDQLGRLTGYALPGIRALGSTWQAVPNRDSLTVDGVPSAQGFSAANRPNTSGYTFDADGRMTARPGTLGGALEWDSLGRLARVRATPGGTLVAQYTYDALDRLLTVDRPGQTRIRFRYQGTSTAVAQVADDATGAAIRNVAVGPDGTVLEDWLGVSRRIYGSNGHHDTTWTADDTGAVTATLRYDPWGGLLRSTGTLPDWRFQGSWSDTSTGLSWAVARWYDPALGSFISEDSLLGQPAAPGSRHLYAYGAGDPVNAWDPGGRYPSAPNWHLWHSEITDTTSILKQNNGWFLSSLCISQGVLFAPLGTICSAGAAVLGVFIGTIDVHKLVRSRVYYSTRPGLGILWTTEVGYRIWNQPPWGAPGFWEPDVFDSHSDYRIQHWSFAKRAQWQTCYASRSIWIFDCLGSTSSMSQEWILGHLWTKRSHYWPRYN